MKKIFFQKKIFHIFTYFFFPLFLLFNEFIIKNIKKFFEYIKNRVYIN